MKLCAAVFAALLCAAAAVQPAVAQSGVRIQGKVTGTGDEPLAGAVVTEKDSVRSAVTDAAGRYSIEASGPAAVLVFVCAGYAEQELTVGNRTSVSVRLEPETNVIELVVVGYGVQSRMSLTGAVSTVNAAELRKSSAVSFGNALQGQLPGLSVTQSGGGMPGSDDAQMYLRGAATLNGTSPLILIDGIPRENLRTLDLNEVENVSVLKDAASTAVFGVRGANGVIIVTTKRGVQGKAELSINVSRSWSSFTRKFEKLSSLEYIDLRNEACRNDGLAEPFPAEVRAKFENPLLGLDPASPDYAQQAAIRRYLYPNHYYYGEYFKNFAPDTRVNVNMRGGTDNVLYFANVSYLNQGGHLRTENNPALNYDPSIRLERWNFRANLDYNVTGFLKAKMNIASYFETQNTPWHITGTDDSDTMIRAIIQEVSRLNPTVIGPTTIAGIDPDVPPGAAIMPRVGDWSVYTAINRVGYYRQTRINLNTSLELELDLGSWVTKGLTLKGLASYDSYPRNWLLGRRTEIEYYADADYANDRVRYAEKASTETPMEIGRGRSSKYKINGQFSINYNRIFGRHTVSALLLAQRDYWEEYGGGLPYNMMGLVARATYNYANRYFLDFNFGYNGSEQFAPSNRFGSFPAFSVAWIPTEEKFIPRNSALTLLKFRASYGRVGNDKIGGDRFLFLDDIKVGGNNTGVGGLINKVFVNKLGNSRLQWEVTDKFNAGADITLFKDLKFTLDYYIEKTDKVLITRGMVPIFQGLPLGTLPKANMGKVENRGFEAEVRYFKSITPDLRLTLKANIGMNRNKVVFADEAKLDETYAYRYRKTGFQRGQQWGYKVDWNSPGKGYWTSQEEIDNSGLTYSIGRMAPGGLKYVDLNGDGEISEKDYAPIGESDIPGINYGFEVGADFKGFDVTVMFSGIGRYSSIVGQDTDGSMKSAEGVFETFAHGTYYGYHKKAWTEERYLNGDEITYPALSTAMGANHVPNEFFLQDRSFLRLRNVELGYTFPVRLTRGIGMNNLRIYLTGQNLFLWDRNFRLKHQDPEKTHAARYPITKLIGFGANLTF